MKFNREQAIAIAAFLGILLVSVIMPIWTLKTRADALQELDDGRGFLARLEAARQRSGGAKGGGHGQVVDAASPKAFLNAQTAGLASAQLEAYLSQLIQDQQASLISSSVQQATRSDTPDAVRIQASLEMPYEALQTLLYRLETGTPYVFIESMTVQSTSVTQQRAAHTAMKVMLNLRAIWHRTPA
jgi:general secretion pathway protein M